MADEIIKVLDDLSQRFGIAVDWSSQNMMPYLQIINMYSIGIEVIKGISGTLGIILTVPLVSVISAWMYGKKNPHESKSNEE